MSPKNNFNQPEYYYTPNGQPPFVPPEDSETRTRKIAYAKQITRVGNSLGAGLLLVHIFSRLVINLLPLVVAFFFPGIPTSGLYYEAFEYALYLPGGLMLAACVAAWLSQRTVTELIPFEKYRFGVGAGCILFSFLGIFAGNFTTNIVSSLIPRVQETYQAVAGTDPTDPMELMLGVLQSAAIPALVEEFAFRGIVLGSLRRYGDGFAIVVSSLLFAVLHGNFVQIPFAFFIGLVMAYAVVRTNSLVPAIIIHFLNNAASVFLDYYHPWLSAHLGANYGLYVFAVWLALGVMGFIILRVFCKERLTECIRPYAGCIYSSRRTAAFFKAPILWAAIGYFALNAVLLLTIPLE